MAPGISVNFISALLGGKEGTVFRILKGLIGVLAGGGPGLAETYGVEELRRTDEWKACLAASSAAPLFVFKHSTTCPISAGAHRRVAQYLNENTENAAPVYLVKVIESRAVSNAIAQELGVPHQSPQILLIHGGQAVWHASHGGVTEAGMRAALAAHGNTDGAEV